MADLILIVQGIRIHVGFYRRQGLWCPDPVDTYVVNEEGALVSEIDDPARLGEIDAEGQFRSLTCLAEQAANDDVIAAWNRDQQRAERQARHQPAD